jgi:four helix bundle protein
MKLEELQVYQLSMELGEKVWEVVIDWDYFLKDTVGKQLLKSVDSIAANLSEGFGRYFYKENKQLCYYSRGSLFETKTWLTKVRNRNLISEEQFKNFSKDIDLIGKKLNSYIKSIGTQSSIDQFQNNQKQND